MRDLEWNRTSRFVRLCTNTVLLISLGLIGSGAAADETNSTDQPATAQGAARAESAADPAKTEKEVLDLDIDQLGKVDVVVPSFSAEVSSVTGNESTVGKSPAAVFVITPEMIRRSGKTSVPELLRLVPGLEVARIDSNKSAITSRGFNSRFANKLLVIIDGRSIYSPLFSGVYWDIQDVMLEDIERIEVIRGPGATIWGANAVNGVINIITKSAKDTQGGLVVAGGGSEESARGLLQYGGKIGATGVYRAFAQYFNVNPALAP